MFTHDRISGLFFALRIRPKRKVTTTCQMAARKNVFVGDPVVYLVGPVVCSRLPPVVMGRILDWRIVSGARNLAPRDASDGSSDESEGVSQKRETSRASDWCCPTGYDELRRDVGRLYGRACRLERASRLDGAMRRVSSASGFAVVWIREISKFRRIS